MIEPYLHFIVKLIISGHFMYRVWVVLFRQGFFGLWDKIPVRPKNSTPEPVISVNTQKDLSSIIGKTTIVYLEDPELAAKIPVHSEKLEPTDFLGEEPDISDNDVDADLSSRGLTTEELWEEQEKNEVMDELTSGLDPDFSTGLTYEELSNAVGVLTVQTSNEQQIIDAAKTMHTIKETDLYEFFTHQVSNQDNVENLMRDCLDEVGNPLSRRKSKQALENFDIKKFI